MLGQPFDMANGVLFLGRDHLSLVTGTEFVIDAGTPFDPTITLRIPPTE